MPTTPNLRLTHIQESQNQKEVTANEAFDGLDKALAGHETVAFDFPSDANFTPTPADARGSLSFDVVSTFGNLTVRRDLIVPSTAKLYIIVNSTTGGQAINVTTSGGTGTVVENGARRLLYCDGTNVVASDGDPFDVGGFVAGTPGISQMIWKVVLTRFVSFADDFAGSLGHLETAPTGALSIDIQKNSVSIGSMNFAMSATTATFLTTGGPTTFAAGATLELHTPSDLLSAADLGWTLSGLRG
ncbi:hypothetical protein LCGC14_1184730 [marine sediment metagenome]|uniref:Uncharacterized protein n=1 Tax=marine sediment metagenome TaxID=412755 RepID=A0A0F9PRP0_9ZZZZ